MPVAIPACGKASDQTSFCMRGVASSHVGEVQLSGFVDSQQQIDRAIEITRGIEGVKAVSNEMSIKK